MSTDRSTRYSADVRPTLNSSRCVAFVACLLVIAAAPEPRESRQRLRTIVSEAAAGRPYAPPRAAELDPAVEHWMGRNLQSVSDVSAGPLKDLPWGYSTYRAARDGQPAKLYLHVFDWHASGKVIAYGLAGGAKRAVFHNRAGAADLPLSTTGRDTVVAGPKDPPDPIDSVVELELEGELKVVPLAVKPRDDGSVVLHARDAIVHGKTLRYEPEPHKNTVGYWTDPKDWPGWQFEVTRPGDYDVDILQGCGKGSGGSTVDFSAAGQTLAVTVQDTGGFQNFVSRRIGKLHFDKAGEYELQVKPTHKPGLAVMDLREVTLTPVK